MMAARIRTPHTTPTTIPAMAPPLMPFPPLLVFLPSAELFVDSPVAPEVVDEDGPVTTEVVVMNTVCCCAFESVDTEAVMI